MGIMKEEMIERQDNCRHRITYGNYYGKWCDECGNKIYDYTVDNWEPKQINSEHDAKTIS